MGQLIRLKDKYPKMEYPEALIIKDTRNIHQLIFP